MKMIEIIERATYKILMTSLLSLKLYDVLNEFPILIYHLFLQNRKPQ
jgi:hypothetical protein